MKPLKINPVVTFLSLLGVLVLLAGQILAQTRTHNLGDYKFRVEAEETINTNDVEPTGEWPQDHFRYSTVVFHNTGFAVFKWIDENGTEHAKEDFLWPVSYNREAPYGIREVRRSEPPEVWVTANGRKQLSSRRFNGTVDPNLPADQMIEVRYKALPGFDVLKRTIPIPIPITTIMCW